MWPLSWGADPIESVEDALTAVPQQSSRGATGYVPRRCPTIRYTERSALTLMGLRYAPTGAIKAAGTTGLPETPGGSPAGTTGSPGSGTRASASAPFTDMGFDWETNHFFAFVLEVVLSDEAAHGSAARHLQIMYGIGGERDLTEHLLNDLSGWRSSKPVRTGNAACDQCQLDMWGMRLDAAWTQTQRSSIQIAERTWHAVASLLDTREATSRSVAVTLSQPDGPPVGCSSPRRVGERVLEAGQLGL